MLKLLDRLGEWMLSLVRFVFLTRDARRTLEANRRERAGGPAAATPAAPSPAGEVRQALIDRAVSLHREKQDVLARLDDPTRRKLTAMAQRLLSPRPGGRKGRRS